LGEGTVECLLIVAARTITDSARTMGHIATPAEMHILSTPLDMRCRLTS
jgi:hypothetical protein